MRYFIVFVTVALLWVVQGMAGVIHESKTTVKFKGLGEYTTHDVIYIQGLKQYKESSGNFQGEGMLGQMMSAALFGAKSKSAITDLDAMKIYELYKEKKQYRELPIEKIRFNEEEQEENEAQEAAEENEENEESNIKITRQVLKVVPTHKQKTINNFPCQEYHVFWITEWVNTETGEKGKDSLFTDVWTTEKTGTINKGMNEELNFQKAYLQKVGLAADFNSQSILGLNWLKMFQNMKRGQSGKADFDETKWANEMKKIKGYPVVIDGEFYVSASGKKGSKKGRGKESFDISNPSGMFGNMFKKAMKKKAKPKLNKREPAFAYHTELLKIEVKNLSGDKFKVPAGFQKIN